MANTPKGVDGKNTIGKQVYISILHIITAAAVDIMELQQKLFDARDVDSVMAYEEVEGNEEHYSDSEDEYDAEWRTQANCLVYNQDAVAESINNDIKGNSCYYDDWMTVD